MKRLWVDGQTVVVADDNDDDEADVDDSDELNNSEWGLCKDAIDDITVLAAIPELCFFHFVRLFWNHIFT